jgi:hypothetical protein
MRSLLTRRCIHPHAHDHVGIKITRSSSYHWRSSRGSPVSPSTSSLWQLYCHTLEKHPWRTKVAMTAVIFASSDTAIQHWTCKNDAGVVAYDWLRVCTGVGFGVVATSYMHVWWGLLESFVNARVSVAKHRFANTIVKVAIDQSMSKKKQGY